MSSLNQDLWNYIYAFDATYNRIKQIYMIQFSSLLPIPSKLQNNEYHKIELNNFIHLLPFWNMQCVFRNLPDYTRFLEESKRKEPFQHTKQKVIKLCEYYNGEYRDSHPYTSSIQCHVMPVFVFDLCRKHPLLKKQLQNVK